MWWRVTQHKFTHQSQSNRENDPKSQYCANTPNQHISEGQQQTKKRGKHGGRGVGGAEGLMVEVVKESSASSHRLGPKASKRDGCDESVTKMG